MFRPGGLARRKKKARAWNKARTGAMQFCKAEVPDDAVECARMALLRLGPATVSSAVSVAR